MFCVCVCVCVAYAHDPRKCQAELARRRGLTDLGLLDEKGFGGGCPRGS